MSHNDFPAPDCAYPVRLANGEKHVGTVFLAAVIEHPRFHVGDYTYASAHHPPDDWATHLAPYLFEFSPETLTLGKFCQIADGVRFITASANHRCDGISSFPFAIFGGGPIEGRPSMPGPGPDTTVGHDVWIGQGACILPGAIIGNGAIIGAGSVVAGPVPDYAVVAGNPARRIRNRFSPHDIERLLQIRWWDWPISKILENERLICGADLDALEKL